ncbi:Peptidoglycan-associated lipoprotein [Dyadobacter sp. CECT 9275]|uniref:Peptidoglycan-associated lipoprotein n=1 Tax=Dyadobacter helix TaxID=2822344 RepID=A0A916JEF7_9BACT|nr:OmpA family protein [Dyadobacter sp. CECT 9275]CAG5004556.1 Peptidoglycan-associated lipoprotein [Dyadobacter sp. CECT 9275]
MINKITAKYLLTICFLIGLQYLCNAQKQWTYDFNNGFSPIEKNGPQLKKLGQPGQLVREKIPGNEEVSRTVYQFEANSGLQFNNSEAGGFLNKSFTVEIYFKMTMLDSWKRVLDFKNRKSDYGSYIYDGKLNFYDYAMSEKAPVKANHYVHYVYSRDFDTKMIKMYINGQSKVEFKDPGTEGMLDADQVLNFFQDDLVANHESSAGSVALIRVYDRVMTPVFIRRSYFSIIKSPQPEEEPITEEQPAEPAKTEPAPPAPSRMLASVSGKVYDGRNLRPVNDADILVRKLNDNAVVAQTKTVNGAYFLELQPYERYRISAVANGFQTKSIAVKTTSRHEEIKSLISLAPETYVRPLATLLFLQSDENLDEAAKSTLDSMAGYFLQNPSLKIVIKGHTDNVGDFEKNLKLSNLRVNSARNYLIGKGIAAERIKGNGYGSSRPETANQSETKRKYNRRVEIWAEPEKR